MSIQIKVKKCTTDEVGNVLPVVKGCRHRNRFYGVFLVDELRLEHYLTDVDSRQDALLIGAMHARKVGAKFEQRNEVIV